MSRKLLWVRPPLAGGSRTPIGLCLMSAYANSRGVESDVLALDCDALEGDAVDAHVRAFEPSVVAVSVFDDCLPYLVDLVERLAYKVGVPKIIMGGPTISSDAGREYTHGLFRVKRLTPGDDWLFVQGSGFEWVDEFFGLSPRGHDQLSMPLRLAGSHAFDYLTEGSVGRNMYSLGCTHNCRFCNPSTYERRSASRVLLDAVEVHNWVDRYIFYDASFPVGGCDLLYDYHASEREWTWKGVDLGDKKFSCTGLIGRGMRFLKDHADGIFLSLDAVTDEAAKELKKPWCEKDIIPSFGELAYVGCSVAFTFMVGYPWETPRYHEKQQWYMQKAIETLGADNVSFSGYLAEPIFGSRLPYELKVPYEPARDPQETAETWYFTEDAALIRSAYNLLEWAEDHSAEFDKEI